MRAVLTGSPDAGAYWRKLKQRRNSEGSEAVTFCHGLKLKAPDGKQRITDCANTEGLFRVNVSSTQINKVVASPSIWLQKYSV